MAASATLVRDAAATTQQPAAPDESKISGQFHTPEQVERFRALEESVGKVSVLMQVHDRLADLSGEAKARFDDLKSRFVGRLKGIFGRHDEVAKDPVAATHAALTQLAEKDPAGGVNFRFLRVRIGEATRKHADKLGDTLLDVVDDQRTSTSDRALALDNARTLKDAGLLGDNALQRINAKSVADRTVLREQLARVEKQLYTIAQNESLIFGNVDRPQPGNTLIEAMQLHLKHGSLVTDAGERLRKNYEQLVVQYDDMARSLERKRLELYAKLDGSAQLLGSAAYTPEPIVDLSITAGTKILAVRDCCQQLELHHQRSARV